MSKSIDYSQFFRLDNPGASRPFQLETDQDEMDYSDMFKLFKGELKLAHPLRVRVAKGGEPADFLWAGPFVSLICISDRVVDVLLHKRFTGWATYSVVLHGRKGELLPGYSGLVLKSWAGERDFSKSVIFKKPPRVPGGKTWQAYKGLYFDAKKWDGSDIFRVSGAIIVVTRPVRDAFLNAKITNVKFIALPEVETDTLIFKVLHKDTPNKGQE